MKHINYPIVTRGYSPMYRMHSYDTRKPGNVIREYIETYCPENGIVLDPFSGSGVTIIEAISSGRRAIGFEINPLAVLITKSTLMHVNLNKLSVEAERLKERLKKKRVKVCNKEYELFDLYKTRCERCGCEATILWIVYSFVMKCPQCAKEITIWNCKKCRGQGVRECYECGNKFSLNNAAFLRYKWILTGYRCRNCGELIKKPDNSDIKLESCIENIQLPENVPKYRLYYDDNTPFLTKRRGEYVHELFDKRALLSLSFLLSEIENVKDKTVRELFKLCFSAILEFVCRLNPLKHKKGGYETTPGLAVKELWIPSVHCINNPFVIFFKRLERIKRGKEESMSRIRHVTITNNFRAFTKSNANVLLIEDTSLHIEDRLCGECCGEKREECEGCVDFILTDPPYGEAVQTYELDFFRNAWLFPEKLEFWRDEIVINKRQRKDINWYFNNIREVFRQMYRVLKPGHFAVLTFHSSFIEVYNTVIRAARDVGFVLDKIIYQPPSMRSVKQSLHPHTSAVGDYYIRFVKTERPTSVSETKEYDEKVFERVVLRLIEQIIAERGEPTSFTDILKEIYPRLEKEGYLLYAKPERIQEILKKYGET